MTIMASAQEQASAPAIEELAAPISLAAPKPPAAPQLPSPPAAPQLPAAPPLYNCDVGYSTWEQMWTPDWKVWCCKHEHRGCPSTSTETQTQTSTATSTATTSTSTRTTATETSTATFTATETATATATATTTVTTAPPAPSTTTAPVELCDVPCFFDGGEATCGERLAWASTHEARNEVEPCEAAVVLITQQCGSQCAECTASKQALQLAGCEMVDRVEYLQKSEQRQQQVAHRGSSWMPAIGVAAPLGVACALVGLLATSRLRRSGRGRRFYNRAPQAGEMELVAV